MSARILIADTDLQTARVLQVVLAKRIGAAAQICVDVDDAYASWAEGGFDLALIDDGFDKVRGREVAMLCASRGARVILMSGYALDAELRLFAALIGAPLLAKPFMSTDLDAAVRQQLGLPARAQAA